MRNGKLEAKLTLVRDDLHLTSLYSSLCFISLLVSTYLTASVQAGTVKLPHDATAVREVIATQCPDCMTRGVFACGTAEVRFGTQFARHFFAGKPMRGYLPEFKMSGREFEALARRLPLAELILKVRESFMHSKLIVVENGFTEARVIDSPVAVEVDFPQALHECLKDHTKPWGCCLADCMEKECCEKGLGSPKVTLRWYDTKTAETLIFLFSHTDGLSTITRVYADGSKALYWCITGEEGKVR